MKRLVITMCIFGIGTSVFCALRNATVHLRNQAADRSEALATHTELIARSTAQLKALKQTVRAAAQKLEAQEQTPPAPMVGDLAQIVAGAGHLSPAQSEQLLADLGFNWASTGDYVIVSKDTLHAISLEGIRGSKVSDGACGVLAITPEERSTIDSVTQTLSEEYKAWVQTHIQRQEPAGDVVANYTLPVDAEFSQSLSNKFAGGILAALGNERGSLLVDYASSWMMNMGLYGGGETSLTVKLYQASNEPHLAFTLKHSGSVMSTDVSPYQPFPEAFLPLFPGGWPDLARREGFELPVAYYK